MTIAELEKEYLSILLRNKPRTIADYQKGRSYLKGTGVGSIKGDLCYQLAPKIFTQGAFAVLQKASATVYSILTKCINHYTANPDFRKSFGFCKKLEELILLDTGYSCALPMTRIDMFFDSQTYNFKYFEFNADGASAMLEDLEIGNALRLMDAYSNFKTPTKSFELFDSWVNEFLAIYADYSRRHSAVPTAKKFPSMEGWQAKPDGVVNNEVYNNQAKKNVVTPVHSTQKNAPVSVCNPTVAIADFLDKATMGEFIAFKNAFLAKGINCVIADITALEYKKDSHTDCSALFTKDGIKIDAVYRRAVTSDCLENYDKITAFLNAYRDKAVCVIGGFKTQVIHDKILFAVLHSDKAKAILTDEENDFIIKHIPFTIALKKGKHFEIALKNKDQWLIKPKSLYGSIGVMAGVDCSPAEWQNILTASLNKDFILQEFCTPFKSQNCYVKNGEILCDTYNNTTGLYMYAGKLAGLYSRQMLNATTTTSDEGRVACSWLLQ